MISLDQIQMLERKVESAVTKIAALHELNSILRDKNTELEQANTLLKERISTFETDQGRIEQGILNALDRLNSMESAVLKGETIASTPVQPTVPVQNNETLVQEPISFNEKDPLLTKLNDSSDDISLDFDDEESTTIPQNPQFDIF